METSDSECFESADEEVQTEVECTRGKGKLHQKTNANTWEESDKSTGQARITEDDNCNVPRRTVCWEPGMDYQIEETASKREPPAIEECWEDDDNNIPLRNKPKPYKPKKIEEEIPKESKCCKAPPRKVECSFPTKSKDKKDAKINTQNDDKTKPKEIKEPEENMWDNDDWSIEEECSKLKVDDVVDAKETKEETNMWDDEDDWEPIENVPKPLQKSHKEESKKENSPKIPEDELKKNSTSSWGSWGTWGLSSVISTATTITSQVSQSITTVLESGIGAPTPEELAKVDREVEKDVSEEAVEGEKPILGFGSIGTLVHGVTKLVETTGSKVISGGLDTLETIGKKTMEVLQENDPGLKKKRAFLKLDDKPILSQVLREAKEKAEREISDLKNHHLPLTKPNYETLFDDHQGLVHLEALEMLSKQCTIKLSNLLEASEGDELKDTQETMEQIKELCELPEDEEEEVLTKDEIKLKLEEGVKELNVPISYERLMLTYSDVELWLEKIDVKLVGSVEIHRQGIETLAQLTAIAVEQFHKGGELLLVKQHRSTADEADSLVQLTGVLTALIGIVSTKFSEKLNKSVENGEDKTEVNELITNIFFEAANSSTYIRDAFQLLIPVLQVGAV